MCSYLGSVHIAVARSHRCRCIHIAVVHSRHCRAFTSQLYAFLSGLVLFTSRSCVHVAVLLIPIVAGSGHIAAVRSLRIYLFLAWLVLFTPLLFLSWLFLFTSLSCSRSVFIPVLVGSTRIAGVHSHHCHTRSYLGYAFSHRCLAFTSRSYFPLSWLVLFALHSYLFLSWLCSHRGRAFASLSYGRIVGVCIPVLAGPVHVPWQFPMCLGLLRRGLCD
jgi:hypothetical protein